MRKNEASVRMLSLLLASTQAKIVMTIEQTDGEVEVEEAFETHLKISNLNG